LPPSLNEGSDRTASRDYGEYERGGSNVPRELPIELFGCLVCFITGVVIAFENLRRGSLAWSLLGIGLFLSSEIIFMVVV